MAKVNQIETETVDTVDLSSDYDMPELSGEAVTNTLEELQDVAIDRESFSKDKEEMFLPSGDYIWKEKKFTLSKGNDGRQYWRWTGMVESKDGEHEGQFQLSMSPVKRQRKDSDGNGTKQYDFFYEAFIKADSFFFRLNEKNAERLTQIIEMLNDETYWMNITRGKNGGNYFQNFKKV